MTIAAATSRFMIKRNPKSGAESPIESGEEAQTCNPAKAKF
jgi:hypothetical protein